ncbi:MAG: metal-dependent hydrolase [Ignavibacteriales bacterium]|nr:metal-dependent hydrolase [Ignavibacteriales bacterium]
MKSSSAKKEKLSVTWFGHSAFLLKSPGGKAVLIDPWLQNPKSPPGAKDVAPVDLILVTHGHSDHMGETIRIAQHTQAQVVAIHEISLYLQKQGVMGAQGMNKGGTMSIAGVKVTMVDARHSSGIDAGGTVVSGGEPAGFVIEFENGYRVYHAGDTSVFGDMKTIADLYKPSLAFLPIGGLYTMGPREAAYACKLLKPKHVVGMHYGTFPVLAGTPAELRKNLPASMKNIVVELEPGQPVSFG